MTTPLGWHGFGSSKADASTVLMLHGFMGSGADWVPVVKAAGTRGRRYLCPDLPGHGAVPHLLEGADANIKEVAASLVAGLEARRMGHCALVGYSMGGRLALYLALRYPGRFTRLALVSASPGIEDPAERRERRLQDKQLALHLRQFRGEGEREDASIAPARPEDSEPSWDADFLAFLRRWYAQPMFESLQERPELLEKMIERRSRNHPRALAASLLGMGTGAQPSLWNRLPALKKPVLLVTGVRDPKFTGIAQAMSARLPRARHEIMPGCGHCPHDEAPAPFAQTLSAFLNEPEF